MLTFGLLVVRMDAYRISADISVILSLAVALYNLVSLWLKPLTPSRKRDEEVVVLGPPPSPVQLGEITEEELKAYNGTDSKKPLLMAIKGQIYDVTCSRMFYGPGGPYALFAGRDASRALAKLSFEEKDLIGDISGLGPFELDALQDWEFQFMGKYEKVGTIKKTVPVMYPNTTSETTEYDVKTEYKEHVGTDDEEQVETGTDVETDDEEHVETGTDVETEDKEHIKAGSDVKIEDKEQVEVKEEAGASNNKKE